MASLSHFKPIWWLASLGIISGLLSSYPPDIADKVRVLDVPVYQGILFGAVIGIGLIRWGKSGLGGALVALLVTTASWIAAMRGFQLVTDDGQRYLYFGALAAGAIGAAGTQLGGALTVGALRRPAPVLLTIAAGAVAGLLVNYPLKESSNIWFILFIPWQALVAACIGYALTIEVPEN